jgi:ATP-binding cassette subfamily E protein 1
MHGRRPERQDREQEALTRIAIVNGDRCKPKKCNQECKRSWLVSLILLFLKYSFRSSPVNKTGKLCIEVTPESKISHISEEMSI